MTKKERASLVQKILDHYFPAPEIPLKHQDSYTLLIAVLLSAQCTDKRVNEVTPHLFAKAHTPRQMIQLSIPEIASLIKPCGLSNTKAKSIWQLSHDLIHRFKGKIPHTLKGLESLPGVGHKTASVVMVQAFKRPAFPVDTHIHRCAKRWGLSSGKNVAQTEKDLKRLFPRSRWNLIHLQIIYFAREFCRARGHQANKCPICKEIMQKVTVPYAYNQI
jgi:endonuclease-3